VFPMHNDLRIWQEKGAVTPDHAFILDMLIPLTRRQAVSRSRRLGYPDPMKYGPDYSLYTCRHWDEDTRLCGAYEQRPSMCRDYPYGRPCERGCGYQVETLAGRAADEDSTWEWDVAANGWRPRSNSNFLWDVDRGVLLAIPKDQPS
jgi:hypothetical protein